VKKFDNEAAVKVAGKIAANEGSGSSSLEWAVEVGSRRGSAALPWKVKMREEEEEWRWRRRRRRRRRLGSGWG
jgi:hypothetical protein